MMRGWWGAVAVATIANVAMLVPVYRAHHGDARIVDAAVCSEHLMGGYSQTDRIRLGLVVNHAPIAPLDRAGLIALGFSSDELLHVGDTTTPRRFPPSRPAWVRLVQAGDSAAAWQVRALGSHRADVQGEGLLMRARVAISYGGTEGVARVEPSVHVEPGSLYLRDEEAARLRTLRVGASRCVTPLQLGNGPDGSVWVISVP